MLSRGRESNSLKDNGVALLREQRGHDLRLQVLSINLQSGREVIQRDHIRIQKGNQDGSRLCSQDGLSRDSDLNRSECHGADGTGSNGRGSDAARCATRGCAQRA